MIYRCDELNHINDKASRVAVVAVKIIFDECFYQKEGGCLFKEILIKLIKFRLR